MISEVEITKTKLKLPPQGYDKNSKLFLFLKRE